MPCKTCQKTEPEVSLKRCAKCSSESYCSRECQKADWKNHKKVCGKQGSSASASSSASAFASASASTSTRGSPPKSLDQPIPDPFTRLDRGTYLHDRPEKDVYKLLIDTYRLRVEDMYRLEGEVDQDSLYGGASDGLAGFKKFLRKVSTRKGLLPPWWTPEKQKECEEFGMTSSEPSLKTGVEKADIIEHYGDSQFPMQLRMLGEAIWGNTPGGGNGKQMRQMLMMMEGGNMEGMQTSLLDASRFR